MHLTLQDSPMLRPTLCCQDLCTVSLVCLTQALEFVTRDYEPQYYYWELLEAWKKLCLVGLFSIILTGQIEQLLIALLFAPDLHHVAVSIDRR